MSYQMQERIAFKNAELGFMTYGLKRSSSVLQ